MNPQMMNDLLSSIRWNSFPQNSTDYLTKMEQMYITCKANGIPWQAELLIDITNQCVYNVVDVRDLKRTQLSAGQQLQLADILLNYLSFSGQGAESETDRQALFNSIFYRINFQKGDVPLRILGLLGSLAITFRKVDVLHCIAVWMTKASMDNPAVISLAVDFSKDFVTDEFPDKYNYLPLKATFFTAVFLITIGRAYKTTPPPQRLINQVASWIESSPRVCFIPPHSAVFELFRWCAYGPPSLTVSSSEFGNTQSRLHLALLTSIEGAGKGAQLGLIPNIFTLVQELRVKRELAVASAPSSSIVANNGSSNPKKMKPENNAPLPLMSADLGGELYKQLERSVDMLFQIIQILISSECLDKSNEMTPIFDAVEGALLPRTPLYELMKRSYFR